MPLPPDDRRCTATSKQRGERCQNWAVPGRSVCRFHGGRSPAGPDSPAWKGGRHSKYLPKGLEPAYRATLADPDRLNLTSELALIDSRLAEILQRCQHSGAADIWWQLRRTHRAFAAARARGDVETMQTKLAELERLINDGAADVLAWTEMSLLVEVRRKLVETERKRLIDMQHMLDRTEALTLARYLADCVTAHVNDPVVLAAIGKDFARVLEGESRGSVA